MKKIECKVYLQEIINTQQNLEYYPEDKRYEAILVPFYATNKRKRTEGLSQLFIGQLFLNFSYPKEKAIEEAERVIKNLGWKKTNSLKGE